MINFIFQSGIFASFARTPQNSTVFVVQKLYVDAASVMLSSQLLQGKEDSAIIA